MHVKMHEGSLVEYHYYNVLRILLSKFSPKFSLSFILNNKMKPSFYQNNSQRSMPPVHSCSVPHRWSTDCRPLPPVFWPSLNVLYDPQTPLPLLSAHGKKWTNSLKVFFFLFILLLSIKFRLRVLLLAFCTTLNL